MEAVPTQRPFGIWAPSTHVASETRYKTNAYIPRVCPHASYVLSAAYVVAAAASASRASAGKERTPDLRMMLARWFSTVR